MPGAGGELGHQIVGHALDFPGRVPVAASLAGLPLHAEDAGELVGQSGVVELRDGDDHRVHRPAGEGPPAAVLHGQDLVADDDVRVQLRIAGAAVVVIECRRHDAGDVDVRNRAVRAGCTDAGCCSLAFEERNQLCNRRMMGVSDQGLGAGVRNRPDRGDRLRHAEREVVTGYCAAGAALGFLRLDRGNLARPSRRPQLGVEGVNALLDPRTDRGELLVGAAQRRARDRVMAHPDQQRELGF